MSKTALRILFLWVSTSFAAEPFVLEFKLSDEVTAHVKIWAYDQGYVYPDYQIELVQLFLNHELSDEDCMRHSKNTIKKGMFICEASESAANYGKYVHINLEIKKINELKYILELYDEGEKITEKCLKKRTIKTVIQGELEMVKKHEPLFISYVENTFVDAFFCNGQRN